MSFDIYEEILDEEGLPLDDKVAGYETALLNLFEESPEGLALPEHAGSSKTFWAGSVVEYGVRYLGLTPPQMTPDDMEELLFDVFPATITLLENESAAAFPELRAFWQFLKREFALDNADAILDLLDAKADARFQREMNNPANFGPSKSMMMLGLERGFDISTEQGVNAWMAAYQQEILEELRLDLLPSDQPFPEDLPPGSLVIGDLTSDWSDLVLPPARGSAKDTQRKARRKRKMAKESRKRNRKKK